MVDEADAGVTGDVVVDAQRSSFSLAPMSGTNEDESNVELEASSAGAASSGCTGSKLSETVKFEV